MKAKLIFILLLLFISSVDAQEDIELNTVLMNSTFKIQGSKTTGTVFILGKLTKEDSTKAYYVLVTANHVLDDIKEDYATLFLRKKDGEKFTKFNYSLKIRQNGKPLWVNNPNVDVAAMYIRLPVNTYIELLPKNYLGTDSAILEFEIHPGDELLCLGYPNGAEANDAGFPILRSGKIASYLCFLQRILRPFYLISKFLEEIVEGLFIL